MGRNPPSHAKPRQRGAAQSGDRPARGGQGQAAASAARAPVWSDDARQDYLWWQEKDPKVFARINALIEDIQRSPFSGIGKPEPLKHNWQGYWSRRITAEHRLVYKVEKGIVSIAQCRYHYKR